MIPAIRHAELDWNSRNMIAKDQKNVMIEQRRRTEEMKSQALIKLSSGEAYPDCE